MTAISAGTAQPGRAQRPFRYQSNLHKELPHVVKFSGGRSSAMMLIQLLEEQILKPERGDVVIFNNTSAEHPKTYEFIARCKEYAEREFGIPFFCIEFQTYENTRGGEYTRLPSYRLVKAEPKSEAEPDGYQWQGEVFEELLSAKGFVPNQFKRICTVSLKLEVTRAFLADWFACKPAIERLGHCEATTQIDTDVFYQRHRRNGGAVPEQIFLEKKAFMFSRPLHRPEQQYADFSGAVGPIKNKHLEKVVDGDRAQFGDDGAEYVALVGLRYDEPRRVAKVRGRNSDAASADGYDGEHIYVPLYDTQHDKEKVHAFWRSRPWDLELDDGDNLSNCTYCFLKGHTGLQKVHKVLGVQSAESNEFKGTPCDLQWWVDLEKRYGRDLIAERRKIKTKVPGDFIGFFGTGGILSYEQIDILQIDDADYEDGALPCDCTD